MPTLVRVSNSIDSYTSNPTFDLLVEGLSQEDARTLSQSANTLMLGVPNIPAVAPETRRNPLAELDEATQSVIATVVLSYSRSFPNKIACIKMIRTLYQGTGLKDAKDFVDFAVTCIIADNPEGLSTRIIHYNDHLKPSWVKF